MVCSLTDVRSAESSVRSFTPSPIQRHSAVEWSCAHAGREHMPEAGGVKTMSLLKIQLKQIFD